MNKFYKQERISDWYRDEIFTKYFNSLLLQSSKVKVFLQSSFLIVGISYKRTLSKIFLQRAEGTRGGKLRWT